MKPKLKAKVVTRFLIDLCVLIDMDFTAAEQIKSYHLLNHALNQSKIVLRFRDIRIGLKRIVTEEPSRRTRYWWVRTFGPNGEKVHELRSSMPESAALSLVDEVLIAAKGFQTSQESEVEGIGQEAMARREELERRARATYAQMLKSA